MRRNSRKQSLIADINITPFTDVISMLLVVFMITTPLISQANIKLDLPSAKAGEDRGKIQQVQADIAITREGVVYLDGKVVTKKELREQIRSVYRDHPDLAVTVRSDRMVRFQEIVNVLDPLSELGITKINIAVAQE